LTSQSIKPKRVFVVEVFSLNLEQVRLLVQEDLSLPRYAGIVARKLCSDGRSKCFGTRKSVRCLVLRLLVLFPQHFAEQLICHARLRRLVSDIVVYAPHLGNQRPVTGNHFSMVTGRSWPILLKNSVPANLRFSR
jgi:hypothetical protein